MNDSFDIVRDIISRNNTNIILDARNKLTELMNFIEKNIKIKM